MEEKRMCANCVWRGQGFENRDEMGLQHCTLLDRNDEELCIVHDHHWWKKDDEA